MFVLSIFMVSGFLLAGQNPYDIPEAQISGRIEAERNETGSEESNDLINNANDMDQVSGLMGVVNDLSDEEDLPKGPNFSQERGFYAEPFDVTVSWTAGSSIAYTLDGSDPLNSETAIVSASPAVIHIDPSSTEGRGRTPGVVLRAYAKNMSSSLTQTITHTYLFINEVRNQGDPGAPWPNHGINGQLIDLAMDPDVVNDPRYKDEIEESLLDIPTFSIVTDNDNLFDSVTGIFVNAQQHGREWERPASVELINPDTTIEGFQINAGLRIRGGYSRVDSNPKHAFRLFFRTEYGEGKLKYPLFEDEGVDEFDKMDIRTSQNYSWAYAAGQGHLNTMLRDIFSRDSQRDMGEPYTRSRYYHLYLNGLYWGLFQTQERPEAAYASSYFGGTRDDYDVVKVDAGVGRPYNMEATDGDLEAYNALWQLCEEGFSTDEAYYRALGCNPDGTRNFNYPKYVDVDNLIDYLLITWYVGDFDAPVSNFMGNRDPNNFYAIYNRNGQEGFKYFRHDSEHTLMYRDGAGFDRTGPFQCGDRVEKFNPQWLHQKLLDHPDYRRRLMDRIRLHFTNSGVLTPEVVQASILKRKAQIEKAIIAESARWGDSKSQVPYTKDDHWLPAVDYLINDYVPNRTDEVIEQFISQGWYARVEPPILSHLGGLVDDGYELSLNTTTGDIYYTLDGSDPLVPQNPEESDGISLIEGATTKKVLVPTEDIGTDWLNPDFDDSSWMEAVIDSGGIGAIGYDRANNYYRGILTLNLQGAMSDSANANPSCYMRVPFTLTQDDIDNIKQLFLVIYYEDGYAAFLNGQPVMSDNAPEVLSWNSIATGDVDGAVGRFKYVTDLVSNLQVGENVLCLHGFTTGTNNPRFLLYTELVAITPNGLTGESSESAQVYSGPIPIHQTTHVKARSLLDDEWSTLSEATYATSDDFSSFKITEIHYHPGDGDRVDGSEAEFLEFKNTGNSVLDLSGLQFVDGIDYVFPPNTLLEPGKFVVLASNLTGFANRYSLVPTDVYSGQLNNGGEELTLVTAFGDTVLNMEYDDQAPWPVAADTGGYSLHAVESNPTGDPGDPAYWKASLSLSGSPGADDYVTAVEGKKRLPEKFQLYQNYPNPFNPQTTVRFDVPNRSHVRVTVFDLLGREIDTLIDNQLEGGSYQVTWRADRFASGIYFVQCQADQFKQTKRMLLLK